MIRRPSLTVPAVIVGIAMPPAGKNPVFRVHVKADDDSRDIEAAFIGRRNLAGMYVGRRVILHGRVFTVGARQVMFNPDYELQMRTT